MSDDRFWRSTEKAEDDFIGCTDDVARFRRRMRRLGHPLSVIRERVEALHPDLLAEFDALPKTRVQELASPARLTSLSGAK